MRVNLFRLIVLLCLLIGGAVLAQDDESNMLPITQDFQYQVRPSDTLETVGALFDVSPSCIADRNNLPIDGRLRIGQDLLLPISCPRYGEDPRDEGSGFVRFPREVVTFEDECSGYRVRRNDTLDEIGFMFNVSTVSLGIANNLANPNELVTNTCLAIPEDAPPYGVFPPLDSLGQGGDIAGQIYVIQPRDTLDVIGQSFNTSVVSIQLANNIMLPSQIQPGLSIIIPDDAPPYGVFPAIEDPLQGSIFIVGLGDTLESIAQRFDVSLLALETVNGVNQGRNVLPGTSIIIPDNVPAFGNDADFDSSSLGQGGGTAGPVHVVQPLESLDAIGFMFNRNTDCLAEANNLPRPSFLRPGQPLVIDENCGPWVSPDRPPLSQAAAPATTDN